MESLLRDLRYGARMIRKTPGTSLVAVLALSFGIGLTTLMFSIIYGALIRGLPFDEPQEIVLIDRTNLQQGRNSIGVSIHDFEDWQVAQRTFDEMAVFSTSAVNLSDEDGSPERLDGALMTPSAFRATGVQPLLGRIHTDEEEQPDGARVMLVGWGVWQQRFGAAPDIIGRTVRVNGEATTIIGVMPRGFGFPNAHNAWLPLREDADRIQRGEGRWLRAFGRLRDGTTVAQAQADLEQVAARIARDHPALNESVGVRVRPFTESTIGSEERTVLWTMFGAVIFVLLIACANVANLLLARALIRSKEVGVRTALGASRLNVAMQFLTESFALALAGLATGTVLAWFGVRMFNNAIAGTRPPFWIDIRIDAAPLLVAFGATMLATLASGAIPALRAARANTQEILKDESRGSSSLRMGRLSRALVMAEMALSVGLLAGAGLMIRSVVQLHTIDMGFDASRVYTTRLQLPATQYADAEARQRFVDQLELRLTGVQGIESAAIGTALPGMSWGETSFALEGEAYMEDRDLPVAVNTLVTPDYFTSLGVDVLSGRAFTAQDRMGALPVAVVTRAFERRFFDNTSAVGRRIRLGGRDSEAPWLTIVGVAPDMFAAGLDDTDHSAIYRPMAQSNANNFAIVARTRGSAEALAPAIRAAVSAIDPDLPLYSEGSLDRVLERQYWFYGVFGALFIAFGAAALFLASVGLYGVMAFSVSQRRREMGVRMAMGANAHDLLGLVLRQGMTQTAVGLVLGTAFALGVSRLLAAILFQVEPRDPAVFAAIVVVLVATATLACWIPARRAARVDPLEALRSE